MEPRTLLRLSRRCKGAQEAPSRGDGPRGSTLPLSLLRRHEGLATLQPVRKEAPNGVWRSSMTQGPAFPHAGSLNLERTG